MAESIVGHVIARISDEVKLATELQDSIVPLRDTLESIQSFLKDADHQRREQKSEAVRAFVKQTGEVAYDVEDVLDEYLLKVELQQQKVELPPLQRQWHMGCIDFLQSLIDFVKQQWHMGRIGLAVAQTCTRHDLVQRVKQINMRLEKIKATKDLLSSNNASSMSSIGPDLPRRNELEDCVVGFDKDATTDVVGFDKDATTLMERLIDLDVPQRTVISIVAMGGSGKTTLAAKVYHNEKIKNHFACRAWVAVSQAYEARDVLTRILREVTGEDADARASMDKLVLVKKLRQHLKTKRYLVVIDDVWDNAAWDGIEAALPGGEKGSRVLLTTRQAEVASHADPDSSPYYLNLLGPDDSWDLFSKKAFKNAQCPTKLKRLQETILNKCDGLPLAIVALGGIMRRKYPSYYEWNKVLEHLPAELKREDRTFKILALSYDVLPPYLKSCFLYFAAYPEDYEIDAEALMRLWIAEGFMQPGHGQIMEDVAEDSLMELIQRNMVLVSKKGDYGSIVRVRIHDLFLELARSEAKEVNFLSTEAYGDVFSPPMVRRLSLSPSDTEHACNQSWPTPKLRTLLDTQGNFQSFSSPFLESKLLRVIDLEKVRGLDSLPEEIGGLALLRYLGLRYCLDIGNLPSSIGNLRNLQTLDIRGTLISEIPGTFWKIQTLRHVLLSFHFSGTPEISDRLNDLRTLENVDSGSWVINGGLMNVPNLRQLKLRDIGASEEETVWKSLEKLKFLVVLLLAGSSLPAEVLISSQHRHLRALYLCGKMNTCKLDPTLKSKEILPGLNHLQLEDSLLKADMITLIAALPNLQSFTLGSLGYAETVLVCPSGGFPRLTYLKLYGLDDLEELEVEDGALPCLKKLCISECKTMRTLPVGLRHIRTLQTLKLNRLPTINKRIEKEIGEDYPKIQHVPYVVISDAPDSLCWFF